MGGWVAGILTESVQQSGAIIGGHLLKTTQCHLLKHGQLFNLAGADPVAGILVVLQRVRALLAVARVGRGQSSCHQAGHNTQSAQRIHFPTSFPVTLLKTPYQAVLHALLQVPSAFIATIHRSSPDTCRQTEALLHPREKERERDRERAATRSGSAILGNIVKLPITAIDLATRHKSLYQSQPLSANSAASSLEQPLYKCCA